MPRGFGYDVIVRASVRPSVHRGSRRGAGASLSKPNGGAQEFHRFLAENHSALLGRAHVFLAGNSMKITLTVFKESLFLAKRLLE